MFVKMALRDAGILALGVVLWHYAAHWSASDTPLADFAGARAWLGSGARREPPSRVFGGAVGSAPCPATRRVLGPSRFSSRGPRGGRGLPELVTFGQFADFVRREDYFRAELWDPGQRPQARGGELPAL